MSTAAIACVRRAVELGNEGKLEDLLTLYHPDAELRDLASPPDFPEVLRGREAVVASWHQWLEDLGDWNAKVYEYIDADPWVVCDMLWRATGKESAAPVERHDAGAFEVRNGLICRQILGFADVATALKELERAS